MNSGRDEAKPHDDVPLTDFEKRVFRRIIGVSMACCMIFGGVGFVLASTAWVTVAMLSFVVAILFGFFWFFQECIVSLRDYGLGEGVANLHGVERAKFMFGEHYKRPDPKDD